MLKNSLKSVALASLLLVVSGCGGGGGSSSDSSSSNTSSSTSDSSTNKYDFYSYLYNSSILDEDKVVYALERNIDYTDGKDESNYNTETLDIKSDDDSISHYWDDNNFYNLTKDSGYIQMVQNETVLVQYDINEDTLVENDFEDNTSDTFKRSLSIGDNLFVSNSEPTWSCNLKTHYNSIDIKNAINDSLGKDYEIESKEYNDVIEILCSDTQDDEVTHSFFAKNIGLIAMANSESNDKGELEEYIRYLEKQIIFDR